MKVEETDLLNFLGIAKCKVESQNAAQQQMNWLTRYYTDGWGAYERHVDEEKNVVGKEHRQKIESKHLNLRTRIKRLIRRTLCFSKTERIPDLVIGLFVNRYEFE